MVIAFQPGNGDVVQPDQGERLDALEHGHQPALDQGPEDFLFTVLVRTVGELRRVRNAEPVQPLPEIAAEIAVERIGP